MQRFTAFGLVAALVRRTWIFTAVTVVTCAAFAANAATALIDAEVLLPGPSARARPQVRAAPAPPPVRHKDGALVERNPFCSSCAPTGGGPVAGGLAAVLQAVLIATDFGTEARATVRVVGTDVQGSWGVGDAIPGLGHVERIGPMWIELVDGTGRRGRLSLLDAATGGDPGPRPDQPPAAQPPAAQRWAGRFEKLSETDYAVDRSLVRELVTAGGQGGAVRMIPIFNDGQIKGVRLGVVTPESIPFVLGLKTGDVLTTIDSEPLKNLDQLLSLYARLDQLSAVELSGTRAGKPLIRTLRLR